MTTNDISRRGFVALGGLLAAGAAASTFTGCGSAASGNDPNVNGAGDATGMDAGLEQREPMGSPEPCDVRVGLIMGPPSMGLTQFLLAAQNGRTENRFDFDFNGVDYIGLSAALNQGTYDIATLPSNIGPILYNNRELKNQYQIISVNNLGVLYVMTTDASVKSLADLKGRRVYSYGEGGTPEYTNEALLAKNGMAGSFSLEFKSTPFEVLNLLQQEENCVAILPQPFVSLSKLMVDPLYVPVNITAEWDRAFADTGSQAVTTITVANRAFVEAHEQAVVEYLQMAGFSVAWSLQNKEQAAALQEDLGTFMNNNVALDALPYISMTCLTGVEMRTACAGFFEELYKANPDSIGGKVPDGAFYYLPPAGAIDDDAIGKREAAAAGRA